MVVGCFLLALVKVALAADARPQAGRRLPEAVAVYRDVPYVTAGHERQKLDLYVPKAGTNLPLIVHVHGGAFLAGSKEDDVPTGLLARGYAVASINYRLSQHAIFPAQIQDCKAAVRWLRAHAAEYRIDAGHFGAVGESAGGHLVAMLGTAGTVPEFEVGENLNVSSRVQAVADFYGPTDFLQMDRHRTPDGMIHDGPKSPESLLVGGPIQANREKVARANPITYVTAAVPPFLIVHGQRDPAVPFHQSQLLKEALTRVGADVTFYPVAGAGHGGFNDPHVPQLVAEFFGRHLLAAGKTAADVSPAASADFELNFAGICPADWPGAFRFYTDVLGIKARSQDGHWAILGAGWERFVAGQSRALVFELFEGRGLPAGVERERDQAIRLGIRVRDLAGARAQASTRGVRFATEIERDDGFERAEFAAPDGTRWILWSPPGGGATGDVAEPEILLAEMRVEDWLGQLAFYRDTLGLGVVKQATARVVLQQAGDGPQVILKPGGRKHVVDPAWADRPALAQPIFLGFMVGDVRAAARRLRAAGARVLRDVQHHDWGGTDLIVADADGNAVQIYKLDTPHSYGGHRRASNK